MVSLATSTRSSPSASRSVSSRSRPENAVRVFATVEAAVYDALDAALVMVMLKLYSLELPQNLGLRSSHEPTMVLFGMVASAGGSLVNVRRRCTQVSSDGGFFSMRS